MPSLALISKVSAVMSILAFSRLLGSPVEDIISWLQTKKLLAASKNCPACQAAMVLSPRSDRSDRSDGHRYVNLLFLVMP